ncbi:signal peptidase II [Candidatus Woesearchaeota archaeon]|nr:signal peptidase II [Candidatus Woesearchaeota archaeon]
MKTKNEWLIFLGIAGIGIFLDQLTKFFAKMLASSIEITSFFSLSFLTNNGALWGMMQGYNWLFVLISILAIAGIIYFFNKEELTLWPQIFLALILAGAAGNLIDRLIFGYVTDFIAFSFWPTFNLADSFITTGVLSMIVYLVWDEYSRGK